MNRLARARRSLLALAVLACSSEESPKDERSAGGAGRAAGEVSGSGGTSGSAGAIVNGGIAGTPGAAAPGGSAGPASGAAGSSAGAAARAGAAAGGSGGAAATAGSGGHAGTMGPDDTAGAGAAGEPTQQCGRCGEYATPMQTGRVEASELNALSGLAVSRTQPDIVFAHNDHDRPVVYALDLEGREHARIELEGAPATDIEDIAVGSCGAQTCVYLGDIGDNAAQRTEYAILRFVAPMVPANAGTATMTAAFERFRFTYEDGSHNAESLMVAPDGAIYIVTKLAPGSGGSVSATGPSSVYRLAASITPSSAARATKVATLAVPQSGELAASAAAAHPCGEGFLLRTYDRVYEFVTPAGMGFEAAFGVQPKLVSTTTDEPQSEGVDYRADGRGFITSGEGARAPIVRTSCAP